MVHCFENRLTQKRGLTLFAVTLIADCACYPRWSPGASGRSSTTQPTLPRHFLRGIPMRKVLALLGSMLAWAGAADATIIVGGNIINQTWTAAGSPYVVQGDITIPAGSFLTIQAGTVVEFAAVDGQSAGLDATRIELTVKGTLNINGTAASPVTLQAASADAANVWYGIVVDAAATSALITFANIHHALEAIRSSAPASVLQISFSSIDQCTTGVDLLTGMPTLDALTITGCATGIAVTGDAGGTISNVVLVGNTGVGLNYNTTVGATTLLLTQATIHANQQGVVATANNGTSATLTIQNSIITQNASGGVLRYTNGAGTCAVSVGFSDIFGNGTSNVGPGTGCISANPLYVNAPSDLRLQSSSLGIDSGSASNASTHDRDGRPRPLDALGEFGAAYDMGAYEALDVVFADSFE